MSAKCKFTIKMEPLVLGIREKSENEEVFKEQLDKYFEDSKDVSERYWKGGNTAVLPFNPIDVLAERLGQSSPEILDGHARNAYIGDDSGYKSMRSEFIENIVERILFDPETGEWFDASKEVSKKGFTFLDQAILNYKLDLINKIRKVIPGASPVEIDIESDTANSELTRAINDTLAGYGRLSSFDSDIMDVKSAYVILSNFDDLLAEHTPYISVKRSYKVRNEQGIDMYEYSGPKAHLRTSWTVNEIVSAGEQYSGLAKTLLNYFKEYDDGRFIPYTSIGVEGFIGAMKVLRSALIYSRNEHLSDAKMEYYKGASMDMKRIIEDYLYVLSTRSSNNDNELQSDHVTFLTQKLQGILQNIYNNKNVPEDIKNVFTAMFIKTVPLKYRTYGTFKDGFKGSNLEERWANNQNYRLQDTINGKVEGFRTNRELWSTVATEWGIKLDDGSNNQKGTILFKFKDYSTNQTVTLKIDYEYKRVGKSGRFEFTTGDDFTSSYNGTVADRLIYNLTGYLVTPEYRSYSKSKNDKVGVISDFAGALGSVVLGSINYGNIQPFESFGLIDRQNNAINFYKSMLFDNLTVPASIIALVNGSETANTVRDVNGNNLPTNGLTSLAYEVDEFLRRYEEDGVFKYGLLGLNPDLMAIPIIREGISIHGSGKKTNSLNVRELYELAYVFDFLQELDGGTVYLQPTTNADKTKTFILGFNINNPLRFSPDGQTFNLKSLLSDIAKGSGDIKIMRDPDGFSSIERVENLLMTLRYNRYNTLSQDLLYKYNQVLGQFFTSLEALDKYLETHKIGYSDLRRKFREYKDEDFEFIENYTATKDQDGNARVNETLLNFTKTFNGDANNPRFKARLERSKRRFIHDLLSDGFRLNPYLTKGGRVTYNYLMNSSGLDWINEESHDVIFAKATKKGTKENIIVTKSNSHVLLDKNYDITINPVFNSYFYADNILGDSFNAISIGEMLAHDNKNKKGDKERVDFDETEYEEFSEASRWISSVKRNVIPGASMHPFLQGKWDGVAETIKISDMEDIPAATFNMLGVIKDGNDSMDGCGISNIYEAILELNSLEDAAPRNYDLKTIGWDLDSNGIPMMLKWAVYALTNERRRKGYLSKANAEQLHKKLNDIEFEKIINLNDYFIKYCPNGFYFEDKSTGRTYSVLRSASFDRNTEKGRETLYYRVAQIGDRTVYLDKHNRAYDRIEDIDSNDLRITTIYDLDQYFGGAWASRDIDGKRQYDDINYRAVIDIICKERLKDYFIAYAVNKSARKVGVRNLNARENWFNDKKLDYFTMSTRHIGLQMNAEHDLLDPEVTEMTQMISSLAENWYANELVEQIYKDIGKIVEESLLALNVSIKNEDHEALRKKLGKSLVEAFNTRDDTIGLAQAFLDRAREALSKNEVPNIPFSAATINGAFISDVASRITKSGIRRKYDGIAAVLSPSYNMISYFRFTNENGDTITTTADYVPSEMRRDLELRGFTNFNSTSAYSLANYTYVTNDFGEVVLNPFADVVESSLDLRPGDTIVIGTLDADQNIIYSDPITIEKWDDYDKYVNNGGSYIIRRLKYAPRDLQGSDTRFTVNGRNYSIYNMSSVRALHLLRLGDASLAITIVTDPHWNDQLVYGKGGFTDINLQQSLQNIVQQQLEDLENGKIYDWRFGTTTQVAENVEVIAAECIMGKLNAEKFGLEKGDRIDEILKEGSDWFYRRFNAKYNYLPDIPENFINAYLYTANGPILVKFGTFTNPENFHLSKNTKSKVIGEDLMLGESVLCKADGTQVFSFDNGQQTFDVICIDSMDKFNELLDSELVETHRFEISDWTSVKEYISFTKDSSFNDLINNVAAGTTNGADALKTIKKKILADFTSAADNLAKQRFWAFRASLNIVSARIPTQAMQSFMPMRIVAFTDDEYNTIYVSRSQAWLQGSDYDIDKNYNLQYSIAKNGTLPTMSRLSRYFDPIEVLRLGKPNGVKYEFGKVGEDNANTYTVSYDELNSIFGKDRVGQLDIFRKIIASGKTKIAFVEPAPVNINVVTNGKIVRDFNVEQLLDFKDKTKKFMEFLKLHSESNIKLNKELALRNQVVAGIWEASTKASVQINANSPIQMDEAEEASKSSVLSDLEKHFSPDIPSSKYKLQEQALGGKDVVGISAVSVKSFFAETTYMNMTLNEFADALIRGDQAEAMRLLTKVLMKNPLTRQTTSVGNINVNKVIQKLAKYNITSMVIDLPKSLMEPRWKNVDGTFNIIKCLKDIGRRTSIIDTALSESGLLSASTDNMKELHLPKLNATSQFVDIYTSLLATGISLSEIANIMTSPMFTEMVRLTQPNLLDPTTKGYRLKRALEFFLNKNTLSYVKKPLLQQLFEDKEVNHKFKKNQNGTLDEAELLAATEDTKMLKNALRLAYKLRATRATRLSDNSYYDNDEDLLMEDFFNGDLIEESKATLKDATLEDWNVLINYLEECVQRNELFIRLEALKDDPRYQKFGDVTTQKNKLELILTEVLPKTEEQRIFGSMLGINQGLRTSAYEMHRLVRSIENFVNGRFNEKGIKKTFELMTFLSDEANRAEMIAEYEKVKSSFNILDAITKIPHFGKMFDALYTNEYIQSALSSKHKLVEELARKLEYDNPYSSSEPYSRILSEKEYNEVEYYVNDWYITGWFSEQDIMVTIPTLLGFYDNIDKPETNLTRKPIKLNNLYNLATFKRYMEMHVIPTLQRLNKYNGADNTPINSFIMSLEYSKAFDKRTKKWRRFYKLPINMMGVGDSVVTTRLHEQFLTDFTAIANETFEGNKIGDLFFLYNLIVNKDGFGQTSLTTMFQKLVAMHNGSSLINSFYDYIAKLDRSKDRSAIIKGFLDSRLDDLTTRIHLNVPNSNIKAPLDNINNYNAASSDFTFNMPYAAANWGTVIDQIYPARPDRNWGTMRLDHNTIKAEIIDRLSRSLPQGAIVVAPQSWFEERFSDPLALEMPAFIDNGVIYIKQTEAVSPQSVAHEFAHLVLAALRFNEKYKDFYYNVIGNIDVNEATKDFGEEIAIYKSLRTGVDLKEEIFAKYLEKWMSNRIASSGAVAEALRSSTSTIQDAINETFGTDIQNIENLLSFTNSTLQDAISAFGSSLFQLNWGELVQQNYLIDAQKVAAMKNFLVNQYDKFRLMHAEWDGKTWKPC